MGRVFHGQPGAGAVFFQQRRGGKFGGKTIKGNGLQVVRRFKARQEHREGHRTIGHVALVGHIINDLHRLSVGMLEQLGGLPGFVGVVQLDGQLCRRRRQAQQQGKKGEDRFQGTGPLRESEGAHDNGKRQVKRQPLQQER